MHVGVLQALPGRSRGLQGPPGPPEASRGLQGRGLQDHKHKMHTYAIIILIPYSHYYRVGVLLIYTGGAVVKDSYGKLLNLSWTQALSGELYIGLVDFECKPN